MTEREDIHVDGEVWVWTSGRAEKPVRWFFLPIEGEPAARLKLLSMGLTGGFGSLRVQACIGATTWRTSIFPQRETGGWLLPLKAVVRKSEDFGEGDRIEVTLRV